MSKFYNLIESTGSDCLRLSGKKNIPHHAEEPNTLQIRQVIQKFAALASAEGGPQSSGLFSSKTSYFFPGIINRLLVGEEPNILRSDFALH